MAAALVVMLSIGGCATVGNGRITAIGPHTPIASSPDGSLCRDLDDTRLSVEIALACARSLRGAYIVEQTANLVDQDRYNSTILGAAVGTVGATAFSANADVVKALALLGGGAAAARDYRGAGSRAEANRIAAAGMSCVVDAGEAANHSRQQLAHAIARLPGLTKSLAANIEPSLEVRLTEANIKNMTKEEFQDHVLKDERQRVAKQASSAALAAFTAFTASVDNTAIAVFESNDEQRIELFAALTAEKSRQSTSGPLAVEIRSAIYRVFDALNAKYARAAVSFDQTRTAVEALLPKAKQAEQVAELGGKAAAAVDTEEGKDAIKKTADAVKQHHDDLARLRLCGT